MDELDLVLVKKLLYNSRITYRQLAEEVNLSVSAIHKRIQGLIDDESINAFIVRPSISALNGIWVMVMGVSEAKSTDDISKLLGSHDNVYFIAVASGKFVYIGAYLRNIAELEQFSTEVSKIGQIRDPQIGFINLPYKTIPEGLTKLDYQILKVINREARMSVSEIADLVGSSPKTIRRHLDNMLQNQLAWFTIEWTPKAANNFMTLFHLTLAEGSDKQAMLAHIYQKYRGNLAYCLTYSNFPKLITMHTWTRSSLDMHRIQEELQTEGFAEVMPRIILNGIYYDCWVDQMLHKM